MGAGLALRQGPYAQSHFSSNIITLQRRINILTNKELFKAMNTKKPPQAEGNAT
jgi:hypothetical protein